MYTRNTHTHYKPSTVTFLRMHQGLMKASVVVVVHLHVSAASLVHIKVALTYQRWNPMKAQVGIIARQINSHKSKLNCFDGCFEEEYDLLHDLEYVYWLKFYHPQVLCNKSEEPSISPNVSLAEELSSETPILTQSQPSSSKQLHVGVHTPESWIVFDYTVQILLHLSLHLKLNYSLVQMLWQCLKTR